MEIAPSTRGITRRDGLIALGLLAPAALLAACTGGDAAPDATSSAVPTESPEGLAAAVAEQEAELVARYEAALAALAGADSGLRSLLTAIRDQHAAHRDALGGTSATPEAPAQPTAASAVIAELVAAEREATRDRISACVESADAELTRLLSLIAASEAAHVPALRAERADGASAAGLAALTPREARA
jgi:hypothetical protein